MKNLKIIILILFTSFSLIACSPSNNKDDIYLNYFSNYNSLSTNNISSTIKSSDTKLYYAENKYVSFSISDDLKVTFNENDIVLFDDGSAMAKLYSIIKIEPADSNFTPIHNGYYIDFSKKKILSKISTGAKTHSLKDIEMDKFKIVNTTLLSCKYENFEIIGNMVYYPNNPSENISLNNIIFNTNNEITSSSGTVFYTYLNSSSNYENISKSDFVSNIEFDYNLTTSQNNNICINLSFDSITNNETFYVYSILRDSNNNLYFVNISANENNIYSIKGIENYNLNFTTISFLN